MNSTVAAPNQRTNATKRIQILVGKMHDQMPHYIVVLHDSRWLVYGMLQVGNYDDHSMYRTLRRPKCPGGRTWVGSCSAGHACMGAVHGGFYTFYAVHMTYNGLNPLPHLGIHERSQKNGLGDRYLPSYSDIVNGSSNIFLKIMVGLHVIFNRFQKCSSGY